ncbi:MAG TPA: amino acid adenylation domain-containing protein, partial [Longimicrobiaceae bacterium]|nr:amino acid adenylation domain-containing protein [Longimicrobiaceae bacterium]
TARAGEAQGQGVVDLLLPPERTRALQEQARGWGVTMSTLVQGAWALLLARYAGEEDVVFGATVSGRPPELAGVEEMVGLFINTLPVRVRLPGEATLREWLGTLQKEQVEAREHEHAPLVEVQRWSELPAGEGLFETLVVFENYPVDEAVGQAADRLGGLRVRPTGGVEQTNYPLTLTAQAGARLKAEIRYDRALVEAEAAERLGGHLETLLDSLAADPLRRIAEVSLLSAAERARVVGEWNRTAAAYPRERCIHELFADQAARTPGAVAVVSGGDALTYAELERRSDRLARRLAAVGVRPETPVGVCLERGADMVVALLGVLKAGGAYLPLDPSYPAERLAYMLGDSGAPVLLTQSSLAGALPAFGGARLCVDEEADEPAGAPAAAADARNAAYVIYTSGSTGRPKGVVVPHRAVVNFLGSMRARPGLSAEDTLLAVTTLSFDIAGLELFLPLTTGARVVVADRETASDGARLRDALAASGATVMQATPATWRMLLEAGWEGTPGLKALCGGEALPRDLAEGIAARCAELWNLYGPTETTIWSTAGRVEPGAGAVSIGGPIANTQVYLLDGGLEPVPAGVAGELYVGGDGVTRGYLGRPELTAERFVPDALGGEPGARLYRTGDRVRWTADGRLEYLGRTDHQVKVRGFRIELGEVEAALREHARVGEAVAVVREDAPGDRRLVAYVTGEAATPAELRAHLRERLPEHMVPGAFVALERLPLTANGKVDRRALPAPELGAAGAYVAPRTATEEVLAGIFAEVLGAARVGAEDGFFELGGHSLLAMRAVSRVRQALGTELPLRALFEAPTVAALAGRVEALRRAGGPAVPPLRRVPRLGTEGLPLSFAQQRLWVVDRLEPESAAYNMPYALRLRGRLDVGALRASLDALVARHETLRTTFAGGDGAAVQVVHAPAPVALAEHDLGGLPAAEREAAAERFAAEEAMRPFDLARGPLLRCALLRLADDDHVLCFTMHHVVSDGWSMQVLTREVSALYAGETLPELPVQYADFAAWQRAWLSGAVLDEQVGYWRERLAGAPPLLEVPTDRPRAPGQSPAAAAHRFAIPAGAARALRELARGEGTTLFMALLAGWQALLGRYAGQDDVVVGTPIAGRTRAETEGLIGFFVNMLALRTDLAGEPTGAGLLRRVRETALGAYDHQELPFERLLEALSVERSLTHAPLFQATFSLDRAGAPDERLRLGDLALEPFGTGDGAVKYDLELVLRDAGDELGGALLYRTALFEAETAARMAAHLEVLLEALAADPRRRLLEVPLLRGGERAQVLEAWNATRADYPSVCLHELVSAQAARTPEAVAVVFEGEALAYAELERASNQLARHLAGLGVGPETRVGVCAERSPELVVALLGVLKAGGAYVPLDPSYPAERLAYMLADSGVPVLLTQERLLDRLPAHAAQVVCLDRDAARIAAGSAEAPAVRVDPDALAYAIYTSGSTGQPKGAMNAHRGIVNRLLWMQEAYGLGADDVVLQKTPFSFDVSVWEFFWPLLTGARLVLARPGGHGDPAYLSELIEREGVTTLHFVPSMLHAFLEAGEPERCGAVRRVMCSGEALPYELTERFREALPAAELHNLYGPTEAAVDVTYWACEARERRVVPIGRPVANTRLYVLDGAGEPAPVGVAGELFLGGVQVGRGYLGRPELTAERFVPDAFGGEPGARLYRTGDRARWTAAGEVEYLGRTDFQVKIRGFRIEPGEIESALAEQAGVREAAVLVREDAPGHRRLAAYVV